MELTNQEKIEEVQKRIELYNSKLVFVESLTSDQDELTEEHLSSVKNGIATVIQALNSELETLQ